jgi:hypothetical protein
VFGAWDSVGGKEQRKCIKEKISSHVRDRSPGYRKEATHEKKEV